MTSIGDQLYQRVNQAKREVFVQGELAQLSYRSYEESVTKIQSSDEEEIELSYPVGYRPDKTIIPSTNQYTKDELCQRYAFLAEYQLAINGIYQLVTIIETALGDLLRAVLMKYPSKLGSKRTIKSSLVLSATSIEEVHMKTIDSVLNEISYKSPIDFSDEFKSLMTINLLECTAFHKYIEFKATRDIYIHNKGIANEIYLSKVKTHARAKNGDLLPVDTIYFLESFEACLQITEWLEAELNDVWHSSEYESDNEKKITNLHKTNSAKGTSSQSL